MNFAAPAALAWAALAVPIVIFYILKIRLRRVPVSTSLFWRQIFDEKQPRSIWQRLRHLLSLLAQLALLMLLVLALADPFLPWEILEARRVVLVVDQSASMRADDVEPSRFQAVRTIGLRAIERLRMRDQMAIISAGTQPRVVCGMIGHQRTLRRSLAAVRETDSPTNVMAAVELARRLIGDHPRGQIIVLSDGCFPEAARLSAAADVVLHCAGERTANLGITQFQVRRSLVDPVGYEILVELFNAGDEPAECRLEIDLSDQPVDVIPLQLAADERWSRVFEKTAEQGGQLRARLTRKTGGGAVLDWEDALSADDQASAILPRRDRQRVLLVTAGNLFLQKAIEANEFVDLRVTDELPPTTQPDVITVLHRQTPAQLPAGKVLVVDPTASTDLWQLGELLSDPLVTEQQTETMLMRHVRLDNVLLPRARQLDFQTEVQVLVEAIGGYPLYVSAERPEGKILVLTVDLDEGDLKFRTAFPIMLTNALGWFAGTSGELREALSTGSLAEVELPRQSGANSLAAAESRFVLASPSGVQRDMPPGVETAAIGPLDEAGIWHVVPAAPDGQDPNDQDPDGQGPSAGTAKFTHAIEGGHPGSLVALACNLSNPAETDLRRAEDLPGEPVRAELSSAWLTRPIWFYLVSLAWLLAGLEWFMYQRRVIT